MFISTLVISSSSKYEYLGDKGKYEYRSGSKTLKFESGALKKWVGRLTKTGGKPAIKLVTKQAGGQTVDCAGT